MKRRDILGDFLKNAANMGMSVAQDNGLYRHLKFRNKTGHQFNWFDIITWPGVLTINGDHGTWAFSRIEDMFEFFRTGLRKADELNINESYWEEKLLACDRTLGKARQFNSEEFRAAVIESLDGCREFWDGDNEPLKNRLIEALDDEVFCHESEHEIRDALNNFKYIDSEQDDGDESSDFEHEFSDTWEINGTEYCYRYTYCLYAIVWAIRQYDEAKARVVEVVASA